MYWGRIRYNNKRQRQTIYSFRSFIYSLLTQQDCVLPVLALFCRVDDKFASFLVMWVFKLLYLYPFIYLLQFNGQDNQQ